MTNDDLRRIAAILERIDRRLERVEDILTGGHRPRGGSDSPPPAGQGHPLGREFYELAEKSLKAFAAGDKDQAMKIAMANEARIHAGTCNPKGGE